MVVLLAFSSVLVLAVLLSALAQRSVLSSAVLFLVAGFLFGPGVWGLVSVDADDEVIARFAELALFSILFTDGMHLTVERLREIWQLPGRALLIGLPLTLVAVAVLARLLTGVSWPAAWLIGAALSSTDPVLAAAFIGAKQVPSRVRELLNVESGLNDGLALPVVIGLLSVNGSANASLWSAVGDAFLGVVIGIGVAWGAMGLNRTRVFGVSEGYAPIGAFAVGLLVLALTSLVHANEFLAAFAAGVTVSTCAPRARDAFKPLGEPISEVLKLAALLLFAALISPAFLATLGPAEYGFAVLVLLVARPVAIFVSLIGTELSWRETLAVGWFGPRGFASVFFGFLILSSGIRDADHIFHLLALVVTASIIAHSSTDVLVARLFTVDQPERSAV
jgi:sodium/hydrogen antiporter